MTKLTLMIVNFLLFQTCWLANAIGAAHEMFWLGPVVVGVSMVVHFSFVQHRMIELRTITFVAVVGYGVDSILGSLGVFEFQTGQFALDLAPLWLLSQWVIFGSLFRLGLDWLEQRWLLSAVFGAIGGPISYYAAVSLDALSFGVDNMYAVGFLAIPWGLMVPLFVWVAHLDPKEGQVVTERETESL